MAYVFISLLAGVALIMGIMGAGLPMLFISLFLAVSALILIRGKNFEHKNFAKFVSIAILVVLAVFALLLPYRHAQMERNMTPWQREMQEQRRSMQGR